MKKILNFLAAAFFLMQISIFAEPPGSKDDWIVLKEFTDEFEGDKLDSKKWNDFNPTWKGRQPGFFSKKNVAVKDGKLELTARAETLPDLPEGYRDFTTAAVKSKTKVLYGYFEIKSKAMASKASSAFWFYSHDPDYDNVKWWTEIDVFELSGGPKHNKKVFMNAHVFATPEDGKKHWDKPKELDVAFNVTEDYHTYAIDWNKEEIVFYIDDKPVYTLKNTHWHQPLYMNFDSETFTKWFGLPDKKNLPSTFKIEYIRSWKKSEKKEKNHDS